LSYTAVELIVNTNMRAVDFAVSQALPADMRRESYDLSKNGMAQLMAELAAKHPEEFPVVVQKLGDFGRRAAWLQGYTTTSSDTRQVIDTKKYYAQMDAELDKLRRDKSLTPQEFNEQRGEIMTRYSDIIGKDTMRAAMQNRNNFALAVESGARGNLSHVQAILSTPGVFADSKGRTIPLFVRNSFGDGVRPAETLAGTYGARSSVVSTKTATAKGGDLLKIMTQSTANYNVTEKDCGVANGLVMDPSADYITGRTLARAVGDAPAGSVVDRQLLARLRREGKPVVLRSAMTCRAGKGLCSKCVGVQADGNFPSVGTSIGVTAAQAIGEPIVQGSLNTKHNAGMAKGKRAFSGLGYISQFLSIPEEFKDRAAVSEVSGVVTRVEEAPQGGMFVTVDNERHFVLPGFAPVVKVGQQVEAGETLSEGLVNPADIVRLRGLGEGRKYYAERLSQMLRDSGQKPDARNVEILSRAALDSYMIDDPDEDSPWLPDDLVGESDLLAKYRPPVDTSEAMTEKAVGKYLQAPALHYTVGTKLTPKMVKSIKDAGFDKVPVSSQEPWFHPEMRRLRVAAHGSEDWLASMGTSYLGAQIRNSLERGDETNIAENYHFGPRLAYGADAGAGAFGENVERTGKF
jgi:DNA-directed RNA polymerase subunit beta'